MGQKFRKVLKEGKEKPKQKTGKMLSKLHTLDDTIDSFLGELEDEINKTEGNPVFIKRCHALMASMTKEYSEFINALRSVVNAVDRKSKIITVFDKIESIARDVRNNVADEQPGEEE